MLLKQLDHPPAKRRFDNVRHKRFPTHLGDVHRAAARQRMLRIDNKSQLVPEDFHGRQLFLLGNKRNRAQIQSVVQNFPGDVA